MKKAIVTAILLACLVALAGSLVIIIPIIHTLEVLLKWQN